LKKFESFEQFFTTQSVDTSIQSFCISVVLSIIFGFILEKIYIKYGRTISNRSLFAKNFSSLILATTFVISVVKSSLALSLGLVGALSIVRFRTAVKEPEELVILFFCIAIGLGLGAGQYNITIISFTALILLLLIRGILFLRDQSSNMHITMKLSKGIEKKAVEITSKYCNRVSLKRYDTTEDKFEAVFLVEFSSFDDIIKAREEIETLDQNAKITFIESNQLI